MHRLVKILLKTILPSRLRWYIDPFRSLRTVEHNCAELIEKPGGSNVVVLSPHPDDDVLGCGGTLYKHHIANDKIISVYMTDGRKGGFYIASEMEEEELVQKRKAEAQKASKIIGIDRLIFLENRDGELSASQKTESQMIELLEDINPDIVYLPSLFDHHPDHIATNDIFALALKKHKFNFICYGYEVWTPMIPNCIVDITDYVKFKEDALKQHKTQISCNNLVDAIFGLSKYRSVIFLSKDGYVECFLKCSSSEYLRLWKMMRR